MSAYNNRLDKIYDWMAREGIALVMLQDYKPVKNPAVRWLTGHPEDAFLFLSVERRSLLVPWDINMAKFMAQADEIVPYGDFDRQAVKALGGALKHMKIPKNSRVEIPGATSYPMFLKYVEGIQDYDIICREGGLKAELEKYRAVKDEEEIAIYRKIAALTGDLVDLLEKNVRSKKLKTEADVALFIEGECRKRGCEGAGFSIIAAGPSRSFGIHAFPSYSGAEFGGQGFSILDFGLKYAGYTTDVTMTFVGGPLSKAQEKMLSLVEDAAVLAMSMMKKGESVVNIGQGVEKFFAQHKKTMPHGLGHGVGLEVHEEPFLRTKDSEWVLEPGMIIAVEPGLYDPVCGGCRLENDVLVTETGQEILTNSRIVRL